MPTGVYTRKVRHTEHKFCVLCGVLFNKNYKESYKQYASKTFCSPKCIWVGRKHTKQAKEKNKKAHLGKSTWWNQGKDSHYWKGGITKTNLALRMSLEYKEWRRRIFERDNYTCVLCGQHGGKLNADHIESFSKFPQFRFVLSNGRTLCVECHKKTPNFGGKSR